MGWVRVTALAMGGSNQSLFLIGALIAAQGSAAVPLLIAGLLLSWAAAPGWLELVLMWPNRVGGIAATCAEAFRPYSAILANLTGVCYWWGWLPTCGLTAILSASALHQWYLPSVPVPLLAVAIVLAFTAVNLCGVAWVGRLAVPIAASSAVLALLSTVVPVMAGRVDWHQAVSFHLISPFAGTFGQITSVMAGLYLVGFAAPAFEAALCHVGEMRDPNRSTPRALLAASGMAAVYFLVIPIIWLGVFGPAPLAGDLASNLGPAFAPWFGGLARSFAIWFMVMNMFHGTLQPLAGASRTLAQLSEDGLLPRALAWRSRTDCPWVATLLTAFVAIIFLLAGDPIWLLAAANFTYLIGIGLPSVAVWLLRRNSPDMLRPWRAPDWCIKLGVIAALAWGVSAVLGFEQFGLPTVLFGIAFAYSGSTLYAWRVISDKARIGEPISLRSLHVKLTGAMLAVLSLDAGGYLLAVSALQTEHNEILVTFCEDLFVVVALLTITVGLVLPGMIGHAASEVARASERLASGTLADLTRAVEALGAGDLNVNPHIETTLKRLDVHSRDEMAVMAANFNTMQEEVARAAIGLVAARDRLRAQQAELIASNLKLELAGRHKDDFLATMSHELRTPLNSVLGYAQLLSSPGFDPLTPRQEKYLGNIQSSGDHLLILISDVLDMAKIESGTLDLEIAEHPLSEILDVGILRTQALAAQKDILVRAECSDKLSVAVDRRRLDQILLNLLSNAIKFTPAGGNVDIVARNESGEVVVRVTDSGIGIPRSHLGSIFDRFVQVDSSRNREKEGTGLGLAITKRLCEAMGGQISVESELGRGSVFTVAFPVSSMRSTPDGLPSAQIPTAA